MSDVPTRYNGEEDIDAAWFNTIGSVINLNKGLGARTIPLGEIYRIGENYHSIVDGPVTVLGTLEVNGRLTIL